MTTASADLRTPEGLARRPDAPVSNVVLAVLLGGLIWLVLAGYQFGRSNHTVYLLDAYRRAEPELLARDWFATQTLQYHGLFSVLTRGLLELGGERLMAGAFLFGYLGLVLVLQWLVWRLVRVLGGSPAAAVMATVLFHLSAAGTGLGGFQFLQDGAFLPSNLANVALLGGMVMLMEGRRLVAAVALCVAAMFHVNHAVVAPVVFAVGVLAHPQTGPAVWRSWRRWVLPAGVVAVGVLGNLLPAVLHLYGERPPETLSLREFIDLYARLRHPHHYDPASWPLGMFVITLWPVALGGWVLLQRGYRLDDGPRRVLLALWWLMAVGILLAMLLAGVVFVSERFVQLALFRFSIHWMLLGCAVVAWGVVDAHLPGGRWRGIVLGGLPVLLATAYALTRWVPLDAAAGPTVGRLVQTFVTDRTPPLLLAAALMSLACAWAWRRRPLPDGAALAGAAGCVLVGALAWGRATGLNYLPDDPPEYRALGRWARQHTPADALFLVPPGEQTWRIESLRAIVINFKGIPQTRAEMPEWKRRMVDVTGEPDLMRFASTYARAMASVDAAYFALDGQRLRDVALKYDAQYVVTRVNLGNVAGLEEVTAAATVAPPWRLYAVRPATGATGGGGPSDARPWRADAFTSSSP
ncbi:MAG: DUF6798 domain-containing protein [Tepidisphaerales bacterium]